MHIVGFATEKKSMFIALTHAENGLINYLDPN